MHIHETTARTVYTNVSELRKLKPLMPEDMQEQVEMVEAAAASYYDAGEVLTSEISFNDWDGYIFNRHFEQICGFDLNFPQELIDWLEDCDGNGVEGNNHVVTQGD